MKQTSLFSFFGKAKKVAAQPKVSKPAMADAPRSIETITPTSSSPLRGKLQNAKSNILEKSESKLVDQAKDLVVTPKSVTKTKRVNSDRLPSSPLETLSSGRKVKRINYAEDSDDDDIIGGGRRKRRHIVAAEEDDDSDDYQFEEESEDVDDDDDYASDANDLGDDVVVEDNDLGDDVVVEDYDDGSRKRKQKQKQQKKRHQVKPEIHDESDHTTTEDHAMINIDDVPVHQNSVAKRFAAGTTYVPEASVKQHKSHKNSSTPQNRFVKENEERYQWLVHVKDSEGRPETDPEYDSRTLYIPNSAWAKFSAFEKQYWAIKAKMWDTVVFFKKGKFFELYEKDADIAHQKFDLKLAGTGRANMRLAGIPEMSFDYWARRFVDEGYKVAKVIQKETMLAKQMRERKSKGKSKVIKRELDCVLTCGTLTDQNMLTDDMSKYCLALKEETNDDNSKTFGVCFIDTSTGKIQITQFDDDPECGKLETLLAQVQPMEILVEKSKISPLAMKILRFNSHARAMFNFLKPDSEFWDFDTTYEQLTKGKYFESGGLEDVSHYPPTLARYYKSEKTLAFSAFGALLWYLKSLKLDHDTISMGNVSEYNPFSGDFSNASMRLDGVTLQNLEIFSNSFDQSDKGTLFKLLNRGITAFGKRAFKGWVLHPLMNKKKLDSRLDSVEQIMNDGDLRSLIEGKLSKLPDLERFLARIHSGSLKVKDFSKVIDGFQTILSLVKYLKSDNVSLKGYLSELVDQFPDELAQCVSKWDKAFDRRLASSEGTLVPAPGVEPEFDASNAKVKGLEKDLDDTLHEYRRTFRCQEMCYKDYGKELYLIEVPKRIASRIPDDWQQMSATSKSKRYWSPKVRQLVKEYMEARELHRILCDSLQQKMYARFDKDYSTWSKVVECVGKLDCLISLVRSSESLGSPLCRPEFVESNTAFLDFKELRHPCFIPGGASGTHDFIPNDVSLGMQGKGQIGLLTGANAAGKSTLLRMTGIAVIMAQIGCFVPAREARLVPVDAIMTRLGANDNIMQGKSTFFVELSETKRMLDNATPRSLIILDELGRGGSSNDGFAIAEAVLHHIATHVQSIGFFATHYGTLGQSFVSHPRVKPLRMGIIVDEASRNITFLYKLQPGKSNGSFGMHVASMCGISKSIVDSAEVAAREHEHTSRLRKAHQIHGTSVPLGLQSDFSWISQSKPIERTCAVYNEMVKKDALAAIFEMVGGI